MQHWFSDIAPFQRDPLGFFLKRGHETEAPISRLRIGVTPVWMINDPSLVRDVLKASEEKIDKGRFIHKLRTIVGPSSLTISGEEHARRRAALHGTFARTGALQFVPNMAAAIRGLTSALVREESFDAHKATSVLMLRTICVVMFGRNVLSAGDEQALLRGIHMVEDDLADEMFRLLPRTPWAQRETERKRDEARFIFDEIVDRVKERCTPDSAIGALSALGLDAEAMRDEIITMLLAGHHTTGSAAAWVMYYLAIRPELADAIAQEAAAITNADGEIDTARLSRAGLSLSFVKEVLRLYPSAHWFSRDAKCDMELGGEKISKGDALLIVPWLYHRSARHWQNPEAFDPERSFSGKAFLPFGAGPRACLGMGVALLELQLLALELAASFVTVHVGNGPVGLPSPSVTLMPPEIRLSLRMREPAEVLAAAE
ncbi:MAG: cytochrome P450 [Alphaproteobacteria bacterium]|nr:cytochrome P450 [Alphaproteobacteria bacterium]